MSPRPYTSQVPSRATSSRWSVGEPGMDGGRESGGGGGGGGQGERETRSLAPGSSCSSQDKSPRLRSMYPPPHTRLGSTLASQRIPGRLSDSRPTSAGSTGVSSVPRGVPRRPTSGKWHVEVEVERGGGGGEGRRDRAREREREREGEGEGAGGERETEREGGREREREREICVLCSMMPGLEPSR